MNAAEAQALVVSTIKQNPLRIINRAAGFRPEFSKSIRELEAQFAGRGQETALAASVAKMVLRGENSADTIEKLVAFAESLAD
jgi:hypothetical protein